MSSPAAANCDELRKSFENREAIYIEKGALRVRVRSIRANPDAEVVSAAIEEVPTPGLRTGIFHDMIEGPLRWEIDAGKLTTFSAHTWRMGHGGWQL